MNVLLLIFGLFPFTLTAQTLPLDPATGKIIYAEEVLVKDGPQTDLYRRAKAWLQAFNKEKAATITVDDAANGLLTGQNYTLLPVPAGKRVDTYRLWFTLHLTLADDRYWYRLDHLQLEKIPSLTAAATKLPPTKQPLEKVLFPTNEKDAGKIDKEVYRSSVEKPAQAAISALIESMKENMR